MNEQIKEVFQKLVAIEEEIPKNIAIPQVNYYENKVNVVSLFSGAGGLDLGLEHAGIEVGANKEIDFNDYEEYKKYKEHSVIETVYALDIFKEATETFKNHFKNTAMHVANIRNIKEFPKGDLLVFGFPCPGFSSAGPRKLDDERNYLYVHCCRALKMMQPKVFIAENVPGLLTLMKGQVFEQIKRDFSECGYNVVAKVLDGREFGAAQIRQRVVIVGVRKDLDYKYTYPKPQFGTSDKPFVTLKEAIGDLEQEPGIYYQGSYSSQFMSRNRKKNWNEQSFTIQASARQSPMHPGGLPMVKIDGEHWKFADGEENERRLSVKEAARIQTFPDWYEFKGGNNKKISHNSNVEKVFKQIGNAVPVVLAKHIAKPIIKWLYENIENEKQTPFDFEEMMFEWGAKVSNYAFERDPQKQWII